MAESSSVRLISWNVAGRVELLAEQVAALATHAPDVVALQEVTARTAPMLRVRLNRLGLRYVQDSLSLAGGHPANTGPRRYGQLVACRWPLHALSPAHVAVPWPERVLSVVVESPFDEMELHTTGVPPGSTNGWVKVEHLEGLYSRLACGCRRHRILCGDLNTPRLERPDGMVVTWGQRVGKDGSIRLDAARGRRWDGAERGVLLGLAPFDLADVFRRLHGYAVQESSWQWTGKGRTVGRRFDHAFASDSLNPVSCRYLHRLRLSGLSDHSAIETVFDPRRA